jgi:hypothetical protein
MHFDRIGSSQEKERAKEKAKFSKNILANIQITFTDLGEHQFSQRCIFCHRQSILEMFGATDAFVTGDCRTSALSLQEFTEATRSSKGLQMTTFSTGRRSPTISTGATSSKSFNRPWIRYGMQIQ